MSVGGDQKFINPYGWGPNGNINTWSANNLQNAGTAANQAGNLLQTGIDPNVSTANTSTMANPAAISSGIAGYMNPYTDDVINRSSRDIQNLTDIQLGSVGAGATKSGAFGGARHGLVEANVMDTAQQNIGDLAAGLRHQGFTTAAGLAGQDILNNMNAGQFNANAANQVGMFNAGAQNLRDSEIANNNLNRAQTGLGVSQQLQGLGTTGYGIGQQAAQGQQQAGGMQQALVQYVMDQASGQFGVEAGRPQNMLDTMLSALGMSPLNNARTQTTQYTPGLFDYLSLAAGMGSAALGKPG